MAEDKHLPDGEPQTAPASTPESAPDATPEPAPDATPEPAPATARRRRRAGAPAGAPPVSAQTSAPAADRPPATTVPEQNTTSAQPAARTAPKRRRAAAPAGPPVFQAPRTADEPAPAPTTDDGDDVGIASDLRALADSRQISAAQDSDEDAARRQQAQIDFASLLFQAPAPRRTTVGPDADTDEQSAQDAPESDERDGARGDDAPERAGTAEGGDSSDDSEGTSGRDERGGSRRRRRRGGRGRRGRGRSEDEQREEDAPSPSADDASPDPDSAQDDSGAEQSGPDGEERSSSRRRRRRRRSGSAAGQDSSPDDPPNTVVRVREGRDEVRAVKGSTRLEAKKQRRREGRDAGRRRTVITEAEFLARRESVKRSMVVRELPGRTQIAVLEDNVLVEHYVAQKSQASMVGNVYLGKVQNVLPSMEAAFIDIGKGRNAVLYAGEVNWDAAGLEGQPRRIELALASGDPVLVQVTKDPIGHKGARLTSQISLPGRYVVFVPGGSMTGISRKLPDGERSRLKKIMRQVIPEDAGVIVRTAAEGASEEELTRDVERLRTQWEKIQKKQKSASAPAALSQEPDLAIKVVRDVFNEDFTSLIVQGSATHDAVHEYVSSVAPDLLERVTQHVGDKDVFAKHRIDEQLLKAMDRKVYLPSGGSLVIDRTEAMTVVDVNTGKFTGSGGSLEETVTRNNLEAAEEIVRQLRLRDIGGIIVIDFIDMVLESNRDLVLRRLVECLGRDRTKHQVAEVTSLGLVQMTRKRVGQGLVEAFSHACEACRGRGMIVDVDAQGHAVDGAAEHSAESNGGSRTSRRRGGRRKNPASSGSAGAAGGADSGADGAEQRGAEERGDVHRLSDDEASRALAKATIASIAAAGGAAAHPEVIVDGQVISVGDAADEPAEAGKPAEPAEPADPAEAPQEPSA